MLLKGLLLQHDSGIWPGTPEFKNSTLIQLCHLVGGPQEKSSAPKKQSNVLLLSQRWSHI